MSLRAQRAILAQRTRNIPSINRVLNSETGLIITQRGITQPLPSVSPPSALLQARHSCHFQETFESVDGGGRRGKCPTSNNHQRGGRERRTEGDSPFQNMDRLQQVRQKGKKRKERAKVQGPKKWFAKCDKHYPSRSGQSSLATAVANFTKPRTSHFFYLCTIRPIRPTWRQGGALKFLKYY